MEGEDFMDQLVEDLPERKRRKYRRYPKPVCTSEQKAALWEHQGRM
jgi:hypothetical protein